MTSFRIKLLVYFALLINTKVNAQQYTIYPTSGKPIVCDVTEVTSTSVSFMAGSSKTKSKFVNDILVVFSDKGAYIMPAKMNFSSLKTQDLVSKFEFNKNEKPATDQVFMNNNIAVSGKISKTDKDSIYIADGSSISKKFAVAIIYQDGRHEIIGPPEKAVDALWAVLDEKLRSNKQLNALENKEPVAKMVDSTPSFAQKMEQATGTKLVDTATKKEIVAAPPPVRSTNIIPSDSLPPDVMAEFRKKADDKIRKFKQYVDVVMDRGTSMDKVNKTIDLCVSLFKPNATIEVSSLNAAPQKFPIRDYLNRIKALPYQKIEVSWTNVSYITGIHLGQDGYYYGTIQFEQKFTGIIDDKVAYEDYTTKNAEIILKAYENIIDGKTESNWDVILGDVGVLTTKQSK